MDAINTMPNGPDKNSDEPVVQFPNRDQKIICLWVLAIGAFGGMFIKWVPINGVDVSKLAWWQSTLIGAVGAFLTVFYVAKTDLRRFWNVLCVALLAGISGPSVIEAIISPSTIKTSASVADDAAKSASQLQETAKSSDPSAFQNTVDDTTQKAATSLQLYKAANKAQPEEKKAELAKAEASLKEVLQNLDATTDHAPLKVLPAVAQIGNLAKQSGADAVASQAQQIIAKAQASDKQAVKEAANAPEVSTNSVKLFFITPDSLTYSRLTQIQAQLATAYPGLNFQPPVHPTREMEAGIEVVYYNDSDASLAQKVLDFIKHYSGAADGRLRQEKTSDLSAPSQIDIHLGPDIATKWPGVSDLPNPAVESSTPAGSPSPAASPAKTKSKRTR